MSCAFFLLAIAFFLGLARSLEESLLLPLLVVLVALLLLLLPLSLSLLEDDIVIYQWYSQSPPASRRESEMIDAQIGGNGGVANDGQINQGKLKSLQTCKMDG